MIRPQNPTPLVLGTRGSDLALAQAHTVRDRLLEAVEGLEVEIHIIKTAGDKRPDLKLSEFSQADTPGGPVVDKGIFTKELEEALARKEIDFAVHSLKDVPTELAPEFQIAATLERAPIEDVLLTRDEAISSIADLPEGACVATSSVRRASLLRWLRPDLRVEDIRGNVPTRIGKLVQREDWHAIILARAGLLRLGYLDAGIRKGILNHQGQTVFFSTLDPETFLPASGQGAIALEARGDDEETLGVISQVSHEPTFQRVSAERALLDLLDAGCQTPIGVLTWHEGEALHMKALVFDETDLGAPPKKGQVSGKAAEPRSVAEAMMKELYG